MSGEGITPSNVFGFVVTLLFYEAVLVGAYALAFRHDALARIGPEGLADLVVTLLGMPDVVAVAAVCAVVSAGAASGAFLSYPKPNVVDLVGPGGPSGLMRVITMANIGFRMLFWAVIGVGLGAVAYLNLVHPAAVPERSTNLGAYLRALSTYPDTGVGMLVGALLGALAGAFVRPTRSSSGSMGGGGGGDGE